MDVAKDLTESEVEHGEHLKQLNEMNQHCFGPNFNQIWNVLLFSKQNSLQLGLMLVCIALCTLLKSSLDGLNVW